MLPQVEKVVICSNTVEYQKTWDPIRHKVNEYYSDLSIFLDNIIKKLAEEDYKKKVLIIFDDVSYDSKLNEGSRGTLNRLAYNAVWYNVSIILICHKLSNVGGGFRENLEHLLVFQAINNKEVEKMADAFSITGYKKDFIALYNQIVMKPALANEPHTFLYICYHKGLKLYKEFTSLININN
jgi:hypothetical protein